MRLGAWRDTREIQMAFYTESVEDKVAIKKCGLWDRAAICETGMEDRVAIKKNGLKIRGVWQ